MPKQLREAVGFSVLADTEQLRPLGNYARSHTLRALQNIHAALHVT